MNTTPISKMMTKQVKHIEISTDLIEARNLMDKYDIRHLPVLDGEKLVGIISKNDMNQVEFLCDYVGEKLESSTIFKSLSVQELMTENVRSLESTATIAEAVQIFSNANFQSLPVTENGQLIGILTTRDVFSYLMTDVLTIAS